MNRSNPISEKNIPKKVGKAFSQYYRQINIKSYFLGLTFFLGLLFINYLLALRLNGGQNLFINWFSTRQFFVKGINPYSQEARSLLIDAANKLSIIPTNSPFHFLYPFYSIFIYLPLSIIPDFILSRALWMTISELLAFWSSYLLLDLLKWQPQERIKRMFFIFVLFFFFSIINLLNGSDLFLFLFIFLFFIKWMQAGYYMGAGLFLTLLTIRIQLFLIPLIVIAPVIIKKKGWNIFLWFFISMSLLVIASYLLLPDWLTYYLGELLKNPLLSGLGLPGAMVNQWINHTPQWLWNAIGLMSVGILFYELFMIDNSHYPVIWKISMAIVLNPLIFIQNRLDCLITLIVPFGLIFQQWVKRDFVIGNRLLYIYSIFFTFILIITSIVGKAISFEEPFSFAYYIFPSFLFY